MQFVSGRNQPASAAFAAAAPGARAVAHVSPALA